ncbi:uncharacterized protein LOC105844819 isoform X3 [Hydra vulgaris]|uniref:uncharacterized protein LOC105844819 isoform X3 n=1 Tax=Hydra vulgaris TaxID=6087 RepID=UPI0032EA0A7A
MAQNTISLPEELRSRPTTAGINNVGKVRRFHDLKRIEKAFIRLAFVSIVIAGIITVVRINGLLKPSADFTFALLLLINLLFILIYVVYGVFWERPFELIVSIITTLIVMLYCIVEFALKGRFHKGKVYIIKLISLLVLILGVSRKITSEEKVVLGLGVPISFFWIVLGFLLTRFENIKLNFIFWIIGFLEPPYIIWLFVKTKNEVNNQKKNDYDANVVLFCIFAAGVLGLLLRILVFVWSYFIFKNFNKGLKEKVYQHISSAPKRNILNKSQQNNPNYNSMQSI